MIKRTKSELATSLFALFIMNGLVGIIIVTNSSRGHHFVYKYPREPPKSTLHHASDITPNNRDLKASKPMHPHGDEFQTTSKVLGYDPQFLANLLSPKLALCDKRFQLTVDDLTFIGHPVSLTGPEFRQQRELLKKTLPPKQVKRGWVVGGTPFMDDESESDYFQDSDNDDDMNPIKERPKDNLVRRGSKEEPENIIANRSYTDATGWRAQRFRSHTHNSSPSSPSSSNSLSGQTTQQTTPLLAHQSNFTSSLLHHPVSMPQTPTGRVQGYQLGIPPIQINHGAVPSLFPHSASTPSTHFQNMSFFHVVFVIKPVQLQLNTVADQVYKNIACKLTAALRYEELNSNYVSQEATKILGIREEAAQTGKSTSMLQNSRKKYFLLVHALTRLIVITALTLEQFHNQVLSTSSLARAVRLIYDGISVDKVCHVVLNDSIDISLQIPHLAPLPRASSHIHRQIQNASHNDSPTANANGTNGSQNCQGNYYNPGAYTNGANQALMTPMVTQHWGIGGMGYMMDDFEMGYAYEYENFPVLFPYHTLLLLEDPEEILKDIPLDANPTLVKLVQILVPYQW